MVERVPSQEDDEVNANGDSHAHTPDEPGGEEFDYQQVQKIHQNVIERIKLNNLKPSDYDSLFEDDYITEADPNDSNRTILHKIVAELGKNPPGLEYGPAVCEFLSRLLDHDVWCLFDQDEADKNPLDLAASHDNCRDLIEQLCKEGFASADVLAKWLESEPKDAPKLIEEERTRVADSQKTGAEPKWLRWYLLREPDKDTCLHIAIKKNRIDYAEVLLDRIIFDKSANIILKHKGHDGLTPLHLAVDYERCSLSHANLVPKLIDAYPDALKIESRGSEIKKWDKEQDSERTTGAKMELPRVKSSLTPFRYFLATRSQACPENIPSQLGLRGKRTRRVGRLNPGSTLKAGVRLDAEVEDAANKIEESLRLNCMRYFGQDREVITQLLPASQVC
jgi:ankyrin repeat protein